MKFVQCILFVALIFCANTAAGQWTNCTLENGGFESWSGGEPEDWELIPSIDPSECTNTSFIGTTADAPSGRTALLLSGDRNTCRWLSPLQNLIGVSPGDVFRLSGMIKTIDVDPKGQRSRNCQIYAVALDSTGQRCGYFGTSPVYGTSDWIDYETVFQIPRNTVKIQVGVFLSLPGTALFDDLTLEKLEPPVAMAQWSRAERWQADIDYMLELLEAFHPDPFAATTRELFMEKAGDLKNRINSLEDPDLIWGMRELLCSLGDSHTGCGVPKGALEKLPFRVGFFEEEIRVVATTSPYADLLGTQITGIDDKPLVAILEGIRPQIAYTHLNWFREQAPGWLVMPRALYGLSLIDSPEELNLTVLAADNQEITNRIEFADPETDSDALPDWVEAGPPEDKRPLYRRQNRFYWFEYLPAANTLYMKYDRCRDDQQRPLRQFGVELVKVMDNQPIDRFVLDVRDNSGGSNIINGLFSDLAKRVADGRIGQTFVITGRRTYSAAVYDADAMRQRTGAIVVGEPTGMAPVHPGRVNAFSLPGSGLEFFCSTRMVKASEDNSPALMPDVMVEVSWDDFLAGHDPVLAAVLAYKRPKQ